MEVNKEILKRIDDSNGELAYSYVRGSTLYGLTNKSSDIDMGGVYMCPPQLLLGDSQFYKDQIESKTHDDVYYEFNRWIHLLMTSNPTVLESLFIPSEHIIYETDAIRLMKEHKEQFLTKACFSSFGGYARSQIIKAQGLRKKCVNPCYEKLSPLDFCYTFYNQGSTKIYNWLEYRGLKQRYCGLVKIPNMHDTYGVYYDFASHLTDLGCTKQIIADFVNQLYVKEEIEKVLSYWCSLGLDEPIETVIERKDYDYHGIINEDGTSDQLRLSSVNKDEKPICNMVYNSSGYSAHCKDYTSYQTWLQERNEARFESNQGKTYDSKNMMHCFRLLHMAIEIARGEGVILQRDGEDRKFLLNVRNHKYSYEELMGFLNEDMETLNELKEICTLPNNIDVEFVNKLLVDIRTEQLKRYFLK